MLYILEQRLTAQKVLPDRAVKGAARVIKTPTVCRTCSFNTKLKVGVGLIK